MAELARGKRRSPALPLGAVAALAAAAGCVWAAWAYRGGGPSGPAAGAYARGDIEAAARLAREALKERVDDPEALRLLARSSARLGRDDAAIAVYSRRPPLPREPEDDALLGLALDRRGRAGEASRAWGRVDPSALTPPTLEALARHHLARGRAEAAVPVAEALAGRAGWEARGGMLLGSARLAVNDVPGAAEAFRLALRHDRREPDRSADPAGLRKRVARTFLQSGAPAEARPPLDEVLARGADPEASWLMSRVSLQEHDPGGARRALADAAGYRAANPLEAEPAPFVGEARCRPCHETVFRDSLGSRHTRSYYRGDELKSLPRPARPWPDPDDPSVTHALTVADGTLREETRVGADVYRGVVEFAFGTSDRCLSYLTRDAKGAFRSSRLAYYKSPDGKELWDRWALDHTTVIAGGGHASDFQGEPIGTRAGVVKCLYCHVTNTPSGTRRVGPETADRAIGCERCHGPGANHVAAVAARLPDLAIANPAAASPAAVTERQCNDCHILGRDLPADARAYDENPGWIRSQSVGWALSRCKTESGGAFGCVSCHDPHKSARSTSTPQYEAKCLACHAATRPRANAAGKPGVAPPASFRPCPVSPAAGCVGCHMPRVRMDSLHLDLTEHFIRARPPAVVAPAAGALSP